MEGRYMKKRIAIVVMTIFVLSALFAGSLQASGDNNTYTNGEDSNYEKNNNNPYGEGDFPGESDQQRSGVVL